MNREALLDELDRLLDAGEPLLTLFPKRHPEKSGLQLPNNISYEMRWYANDVALRAKSRKQYRDCRQRNTINYVAGLVKKFEAGLLGWRAIGVLQ